MAASLGRDTLPEQWSYGVCRDGRVFFISDKTRITTWLHPRSGEPVNSGHMIRSDLPQGWEEGFTDEGASYFINHNQRTTTFRHPVTGQISPESMDFILQEQPKGARITSRPVGEQLSSATVSEASTAITSSTVDTTSASKGSRSSGKVHNFGKREQAIKRNPNVPVVVRGWLYKQDSSGMRLWKRKWFVLADFCLFYYKENIVLEIPILGSIPLPSYVISPVGLEDHINRKYAFKAEHTGMRTYYFSTDTQEDMNTWLRAMNQAALMQSQTDTLIRLVRLEMDTHTSLPSPVSRVPSRAPSRAASTLPSGVCTRNGLISTPSPILEPNGIAAGTYQRAPVSSPANTNDKVHRRSALEQVEQWVKVQKAEHKGPPSRENTLPRRTPPTQHKFTTVDVYQTLPKTPRQSPPPGRLGEYKYAQDRLSHFRLNPEQGGPGSSTVWQLDEGQGPVGDRSVVDLPFTVSPRRNVLSVCYQAATIERRSMPPSGYMTHTVSAPSLHGKTVCSTNNYIKHGLYSNFQAVGSQTVKESGKPVKVAESDVDVKLSRLCEQDKILKDLEARISSLKEDKDKLESILDVSHQQMEQYQEQPAHAHKIAYQQRLLQEDLVTIRAQISRLSTEMALAWEEYNQLERSVEQLRTVLQAHMNHSQEKSEMKRELWRIEDVMAGLSASKANYRITIDSVQNPERKLVPSVSEPAVPSHSTEVQSPPRSTLSHTSLPSTVPQWAEDSAPPRPPLPHLYDYEETPPVVPPLPKEASVIRHTSVRGLKRQSDERKRDRESGQYVTDLRSYLSEPELPGMSQHSTGSLHIFSCSLSHQDRPKSALERLSSPTEVLQLPGSQPQGRMTAEEQLERMKRHQKALVRERKRNLSQGDRSCTGLSTTTSQSDEGWNQVKERGRLRSDEWVIATATCVREVDVEPVDYNLDISRELSTPQKVPIPERYVESDPEEPVSPEELEERFRRAERIKCLLAKSRSKSRSLDAALQQQERLMNVSHALASEASRKSKLVAG
uniref:Pleckstrin homology domain containing, family A member 7b n=1 Tax=Monopterus albus TaxID=43700 RepID=A0A3Q3JPR1_MONAL